MAAVDSLLRVASERRADGLVIATGQVPILSRAGSDEPLSMPALDSTLVNVFIREVAGEEGATGVFDYSAPVGLFRAQIETSDGGFRLEFQKVEAEVKPTEPANRPELAVVPLEPKPGRAEASADTSETALDVPSGLDPRIDALLARAEDAGASDLFVSEGAPPRLRVRGLLRELADEPSSRASVVSILSVAGPAAQRELMERGSADFSLDRRPRGGYRHRVNIFRHQRGLAAAIRAIQNTAPSLDSLNLPSSLTRLVEFPNGLVLIGGPTGSGKSATACALLSHLNRSAAKHIVTLEDPVEYEHASRRSLVHQREIGHEVASFADGIRAAMRESPDVIFVGEMRDAETMAAALSAAETGHLVLATIHSRGSAWAVERIVDCFPEHRRGYILSQLAGSLRAVLAQLLLPSADGGRVPALELLINNNAAATKIREGRCHQLGSIITTGAADGMVPLERSLAELARSGRISRSTAMESTLHPEVLTHLLR